MGLYEGSSLANLYTVASLLDGLLLRGDRGVHAHLPVSMMQQFDFFARPGREQDPMSLQKRAAPKPLPGSRRARAEQAASILSGLCVSVPHRNPPLCTSLLTSFGPEGG